MKRILLFTMVSFSTMLAFGQGQIGNGDMEAWANNDEPDNWNSFLTGDGFFATFASDQCDPSTDVRPGTSGTTSCKIFSTSVLGIVANGNVTLGRIHMGSSTPTSTDNYNYTDTGDSDFSQALTDSPDSIVFWAKFVPNGGNGNARMKATLHTNYDYRDPEDTGSSAEVVASAELNFPSAGGGWMRYAVPFVAGPASNNAFILVTFTTNETAGGGDAGDELYIDDVELIYNPAVSVDEKELADMYVSMNNETGNILVGGISDLNGTYSVFNAMGQMVQTGAVANEIPFNQTAGMYFVNISIGNTIQKFEIVKN